MSNSSLDKYLNDKCTRKEFDEALEMLTRENSDKDYNDILFAHWQKCQEELVETFPETLNIGEPKRESKRYLQFFAPLKTAVMIAILIAIGLVVSKMVKQEPINYTTTFISANQTKNIDLKDGSSITLCAGSKIELADNFNKRRDVNLLGKASFEVKHIDKTPFSVHTDKICIKVTGTSFNVRNFSSEPTATITVKTGKVEVSLASTSEKDPILLMPGQQLIFNKKDNDCFLRNVNSDRYVDIRDHELYYNETPLFEIITDIENYYSVQIEVQDSTLLDSRVTGTYTNLDLHEVLKSVCFINKLSYQEISHNQYRLLVNHQSHKSY
ncbi:MAG: FecR family protein [Mangrovibacterium sp.]